MGREPPLAAPAAADFAAAAQLISAARQRALQAVSTTLIGLYWQISEHIGRKIATAEWGDGVVVQLARYLARTQPGQRGFTRPNLFRMRQFYEARQDAALVSAVLRQIPRPQQLIILGQNTTPAIGHRPLTHLAAQPPRGKPLQSLLPVR